MKSENEMTVDFAVEVWQVLVALYARLVVKELNAEEGPGIYFSAIVADDDDREFLLFCRSTNGKNETQHQQVATVTLLSDWVEGKNLRELLMTLTFAGTKLAARRRITEVATQVLADLVAVSAFVSVKHEEKVVQPQNIPYHW